MMQGFFPCITLLALFISLISAIPAGQKLCPLYMASDSPCTEPWLQHCPCAQPAPASTISDATESENLAARDVVAASVNRVIRTSISAPTAPSVTDAARVASVLDVENASADSDVTVATEQPGTAPAPQDPTRGASGGSTWEVAMPGSPLTLSIVEK